MLTEIYIEAVDDDLAVGDLPLVPERIDTAGLRTAMSYRVGFVGTNTSLVM